jgi:hypothetical protein
MNIRKKSTGSCPRHKMNTFHEFKTKIHCSCLILSNAKLSSALKISYMYFGAHYCLVYLLMYSGVWLLDLCCPAAPSFGNHMIRMSMIPLCWRCLIFSSFCTESPSVTTCNMLPLYGRCLSLSFMLLVLNRQVLLAMIYLPAISLLYIKLLVLNRQV